MHRLWIWLNSLFDRSGNRRIAPGMRVLIWSEVHRIDEAELSIPFVLRADMTERLQRHRANERQDPAGFHKSLFEEKALYAAAVIIPDDEYVEHWVQAVYPALAKKIRNQKDPGSIYGSGSFGVYEDLKIIEEKLGPHAASAARTFLHLE